VDGDPGRDGSLAVDVQDLKLEALSFSMSARLKRLENVRDFRRKIINDISPRTIERHTAARGSMYCLSTSSVNTSVQPKQIQYYPRQL
jgi:hypothetical protein